jgi:hypothetical protein
MRKLLKQATNMPNGLAGRAAAPQPFIGKKRVSLIAY